MKPKTCENTPTVAKNATVQIVPVVAFFATTQNTKKRSQS
jgi:hypothetical protein